MSTGFFIGIKESYIPEAKEEAKKYIKAINKVLKKHEVDEYKENEEAPDVYEKGFFGKSVLDHHSSGCLVKLCEYAEKIFNAEHLRLVKLNPYRVAFIPIDFEKPFVTDYQETLWGDNPINLNAGSSYRLKNELIEVAVHLGIEFENGEINEEQIEKINELEPFETGEDSELTEDLRSAWLLMYEGARLSIENKIALSLAG